MSEATGFHDMHGIPIHVGDLIRVKHFQHRRNRRQMWLYFRVAIHPLFGPECESSVRFVVQAWHLLDPSKWQCFLCECRPEESEVLDDAAVEFRDGGKMITFNERPRKKKV